MHVPGGGETVLLCASLAWILAGAPLLAAVAAYLPREKRLAR